jgi:hypothetical protein
MSSGGSCQYLWAGPWIKAFVCADHAGGTSVGRVVHVYGTTCEASSHATHCAMLAQVAYYLYKTERYSNIYMYILKS